MCFYELLLILWVGQEKSRESVRALDKMTQVRSFNFLEILTHNYPSLTYHNLRNTENFLSSHSCNVGGKQVNMSDVGGWEGTFKYI